MVQILVILIFLPITSFAYSPWIPEKNKEIISYNFSTITSYNKYLSINSDLFKLINDEIEFWSIQKINIAGNNKLPNYIKLQRLELYNDKIKQLQELRNRVKLDYLKASNFLSFEKGIYEKFSIGINAVYGRKKNYLFKDQSFHNFEIYGKYNLCDYKNYIFSSLLGIKFDNSKKNSSLPYLGGIFAFVRESKSKIKFITEMEVINYFDRKNHYISRMSQTLETENGYFISLSSFVEFNKNYSFSDSYFYRDQISIAKKITQSIFTDRTNLIITLGLFNDYFGIKRILYGRGLSLGVWIEL